MPIRNSYTAIHHKESGNLAHFDCVLRELAKENNTKLGRYKKIYYIGAGNFAIVKELYDKRGHFKNYEVLERIAYEKKGKIKFMPSRETKDSNCFGLILKTHPFGDGNTIISLLDKVKGKIDIVSFGSGKEKSSRRSALLVSNVISGNLNRKSEEYPYSLKEVNLECSFPGITADFYKLSYLYLLLEIIDKLTVEDFNAEIYPLIVETMEKMETNIQFEKYVYHGILKIMTEQGILPHFTDLNEFQEEIRGYSRESPFLLGNGSFRFIYDIFNNDGRPDLLNRCELSVSVIGNLLDLVSIIMTHHTGKTLTSLDLIKIKGISQGEKIG